MYKTVIAAIVAIAAAVIAATPAAAKRVALVVGNSEYHHAAPLRNPRNDAQALSSALRSLEFEVIVGLDLTRLEFEATVRRFARAIRGADTALFFYAGHALQVEGQNYLVPTDAKLADEADLPFETLQLEKVLAQMERERRTNLVFLDACRDNPLARNLARSMGTRSVSLGRGLARVESGVGTLVSFATQPGNIALDGEGDNSPFTSALLKHITTPNLDVVLLMRRVREDVMAETSDRQVPWSNSSLVGSFSFLTDDTAAAASVSGQDDARVAALQKELDSLKERLEGDGERAETPPAAPQTQANRPEPVPPNQPNPNIYVTRLTTQIRDDDVEAAYQYLKSNFGFYLESRSIKFKPVPVGGTGTSILYVWARSLNARDAQAWCGKLAHLSRFDPYPNRSGGDVDCQSGAMALSKFEAIR